MTTTNGAPGANGKIIVTTLATSDLTLIASISPVAGTDAMGNNYKAGIYAYDVSGNAVGFSNSGLLMTPAAFTPVSGVGNLWTDASGNLNYTSPAGTTTQIVAGP